MLLSGNSFRTIRGRTSPILTESFDEIIGRARRLTNAATAGLPMRRAFAPVERRSAMAE